MPTHSADPPCRASPLQHPSQTGHWVNGTNGHRTNGQSDERIVAVTGQTNEMDRSISLIVNQMNNCVGPGDPLKKFKTVRVLTCKWHELIADPGPRRAARPDSCNSVSHSK